MKVVIMAGGLGTRLAEETEVKPKPMVEIGGRPILWHIMRHYAHYGFKEFVIALGYKGEVIKHYFLDYYYLNGSMTIDLATGQVQVHRKECEDWIVQLIDTGHDTYTGGRVKRLEPWLRDGTFMVTYGDGAALSNGDAVGYNNLTGKLRNPASTPMQSVYFFSRDRGLDEISYIHLSEAPEPEWETVTLEPGESLAMAIA